MPNNLAERRYWSGWEKLFKIKGLIDPTKPINYISADEIKKYTHLEPRNMAKFDRFEDQPPVFRDKELFILPVSNGQYILINGQGYHDLEPIKGGTKTFSSRLPINLLTPEAGIGEMQRVDWAYNSGLLSHFTGLDNLYLTIRGRKFSPAFSFKVGKVGPVSVKGVQVEIDGGFEAANNLVLLEAKIGNPDNFIIRQLFYPVKMWHKNIPQKPAKALFFTYINEKKTYNFWEYKFTDLNNYSSIKLIKSASYKIREPESLISSEEVISVDKVNKNIGWVIPQANDLDKVAELAFRVSKGLNNATKIAEYFEFDRRQSSYYREATESLGLIVLKGNQYVLTDVGKQFVNLSVFERNKMLCRLLFELPLFNQIMKELYLKRRVSIQEIAEIIQKNSSLSGSTLIRRAQSIMAWFKWVQERLGILIVKNGNISL